MRRAVLACALAGSLACSRQSLSSVDRLQDEATTAIRRGDFTSAQSLSEEGVARTRPDPESTQAWTFRLLRAESLVLQLKQAEAGADLAAEIPSSPEFSALRARQRYLQARAEVSRGRLNEALTALGNARAAPASPDLLLDLDVLEGQIRLRLGQRAEADAVLERAVSNAVASHDAYHEAQALNNVGMGRLVRGRFDDALPWFERVLEHRDLELFAVYAAAMSNAGICYTQLGEFDRATALQRRAIEILERRGSRGDMGQALGELGRTFLLAGEPRRALPYLMGALEVARALRQDPSAALWAGNIAEAEIELRAWDAAREFNDEATNIRTTLGTGRLVWNTLNAARIAEGRGQAAEAAGLYERAVAGSTDEPAVQWDANAGLARVALSSGNTQRAIEHYERALQTIERTHADLLKTDYKLSYLSSLIQFYREYVSALIGQGMVDRAIEVADSSRGRVLAERQRTTTSPTRAGAAAFRTVARDSQQVMLFYWLQPEVSWLWVVTASEIHLVKLPAAERLESLVRDYQRTIASTLADPLAASGPGDELYAALVAPAARWLSPPARLLIVPDGALHGLNFETLPVGGARRHYWIEDVEIQTVPSLGLLMSSAPKPSAGHDANPPPLSSLLLIGSPSVSDPKFPALSYASSEMSKVAAHFEPGRVVSYDGPRASPAAYRSAAPERFSMIHFTAHAAANVESPLDSAVILASDRGSYKLYARDIADATGRPLQADLVTVSACRGAGERTFSGEGLIGFAWAFLRAGARRVIAGLWDVDDQSTADLMDALYGGLAHGEPPSRALRNAKLAMLRRGGLLARPYYWGPFELFTITP